MTAEDRPATRFDEAELLGDPLPDTTWMFEAEREAYEPERSGAVFLYLAVILAIVAGAAIAWLWWTFR